MPAKPSAHKPEPPIVPVVRVVEAPEDFGPEVLPQILREINDRQWRAVTEVLVEAKFKAEAMLRNDTVFDSMGRCAYYSGWVAYADYVIGSLDRIRSEVPPEELSQPLPGPE